MNESGQRCGQDSGLVVLFDPRVLTESDEIGTSEEAQVAASIFVDPPSGDALAGWRVVGAGKERTAYLSPTGIVIAMPYLPNDDSVDLNDVRIYELGRRDRRLQPGYPVRRLWTCSRSGESTRFPDKRGRMQKRRQWARVVSVGRLIVGAVDDQAVAYGLPDRTQRPTAARFGSARESNYNSGR